MSARGCTLDLFAHSWNNPARNHLPSGVVHALTVVIREPTRNDNEPHGGRLS